MTKLAQRGKLNWVVILIKNFISYLIFTNRCKYCGELIKYNQDVCAECKNSLPRIAEPKCKFCGVEKEKCVCKNAKTRYDGISAPFYYEGTIEKSIKYFKFDGREFVAETLAKDLAKSVKTDFPNVHFDFIDFIPFSKNQKKSRAFNPAGELARNLSKYLNIPVCEVLTKPFETDVQHITGGAFRKGNVAGAYEISENANVKGKTILLVDDIKTTGATLSECTRVLKIAGADKVYCAVASIASKKKQ